MLLKWEPTFFQLPHGLMGATRDYLLPSGALLSFFAGRVPIPLKSTHPEQSDAGFFPWTSTGHLSPDCLLPIASVFFARTSLTRSFSLPHSTGASYLARCFEFISTL